MPATIGLLLMMLFVPGNHLHRALATNTSANAPRSAVAPQSQWRPWTAVASSGAIDPMYFSVAACGSTPNTPSDLGFKGGSTAMQLLSRYNVTNTFDNNANPNDPGWNTLELGAIAPGNSSVKATLYRIEQCSGQIVSPIPTQLNVPLCSVTISAQTTATCKTCTFTTPIDFGSYLYLVEVRIARNHTKLQPLAYTLRVY